MQRFFLSLGFCVLATACGGDDSESDSGGSDAAVSGGPDAAVVDAGGLVDAATFDAEPGLVDAQVDRQTLLPGFCPSSVTAPGLYEGTLASNTNDLSGCDGQLSAPGRDGAVRLELAPGATVSATLRHAGDGALYILDLCPVTSSCLDSSDGSLSGPEQVTYTNDTGVTNTVYVVLDSDELAGPQTFELDLAVD